MANTPKPSSKYADKSAKPIEVSHRLHNPPVAWCKRCQKATGKG